MKKYELVKEDTKRHFGVTLYRVRYLIDLPGIKAGDLGGYIASEKNLSQDGGASVRENARVRGNASIRGNSIVTGNSIVCGNSIVDGATLVDNNAVVTGYAVIKDYAQVLGNTRVDGNAIVAGDIIVEGSARVANDSVCKKFNPINIIGLTYYVTITDNNVHIGCKTFKLKQALELASNWESTKLEYAEAKEIEAEKEIIVDTIKFRLYQLEQLSKERGGRL